MGSHFTLNQSNQVWYDVPLHGIHNMFNAIIAIMIGQFYKVAAEMIQQALQQASITEMHFQFITAKSGFTIINDAWNASHSSVKAAIETLEKLALYEKKIIVLGDMLELGEKGEEYHREIGRILNPATIQYVFTYGNLAGKIAEEAKKNYPTDTVQTFANKTDIANKIVEITTENDVVLLKGSRGMALEEIVAKWI